MMIRVIKELLKEWQLNEGASEGALRGAAASLGCAFPVDYVQFMRTHDGGEGFIGENYFILWRVEELVPFNDEYQVAQYAPGLILFGSNGGGEAYGFDARSEVMAVVRIPFIGMAWEYANAVGKTLTESLEQLAK